MNNQIGKQLGNYILSEYIGPGGFADVYLAEHVYLKRQAAIKLLHVQLNAVTLEQFLTEAQIIARLSHPHIIPVYDFGIDQNIAIPFLVMEYAPNGTLRQKEGTKLSPGEVVGYLKQVASALSYVHTIGLIHRDIKPENLLRNYKNAVLLSDFGISIEAQSQSRLDALGTVDYMAPEQIKGYPCFASDQYALAIVAYEWLCGTCPFEGTTSQEIAFQHLTTPPPSLRDKNPDIPPEIEQVILKALEKDASQRYPTVVDFSHALEQALSQKSPIITAPSTSTPTTKQGTCITVYRGHTDFVRAVAWSPNGQKIASGGDDWEVHTWDAHTGDNSRPYKAHQGQIRTLAWSPDGISIASGTATQIAHIWNFNTLTTTITYQQDSGNALSFVYSLAWSPDGKQIASGGSEGTIHIWDTQTGQRQALYNNHTAEVQTLAWSPDGKHIASAGDDKNIHIWNVTTKKHIICTGHTRRINCIAWSHNGKHIASGSDDRTLRLWESSSGAYNTTYQHARRIRTVAWSPDDTRIATAGDEKTVQVREITTGNLLFTCTGHDAGINSVAWSYDGMYIASGSSDGRVRVWQAL